MRRASPDLQMGAAMNREYRTLGKFLGVVAPPIEHPEELKAAYDRITRLEADLSEVREYLETEVDVVDGDYGVPAPNRAMELVSMIDEALHGPGGF